MRRFRKFITWRLTLNNACLCLTTRNRWCLCLQPTDHLQEELDAVAANNHLIAIGHVHAPNKPDKQIVRRFIADSTGRVLQTVDELQQTKNVGKRVEFKSVQGAITSVPYLYQPCGAEELRANGLHGTYALAGCGTYSVPTQPQHLCRSSFPRVNHPHTTFSLMRADGCGCNTARSKEPCKQPMCAARTDHWRFTSRGPPA